MKERPILFSSAMVRAILDGRKTQTRRVMRPQPPAGWFGESPDETREDNEPFGITPRWLVERCPHGKPGDRLWVRETWGIGTRPCPVNGWRDGIEYRADAVDSADLPLHALPDHVDADSIRRGWRPSIFMPRWASRITLEITEVRVQRLQEITPADACDEGALEVLDVGHPLRAACYEKHGTWTGDERQDVDGPFAGALAAFATLWDSINGKRAPWSTSPWVWALTFRRLP